MQNNKNQLGFTLIELMIAIALGLLIVAAGLSLFINGLKGSKMQEGALQIQDSGIFGLDYIAEQVRLANYANVENRTLHDQTPFGGIVFSTGLPTASNVNLAVGNKNETTVFANSLLTQSSGSGTKDWVGLSNTDVGSDQLTIQFIAPKAMNNCEGDEVRKGDRVIQRYFVREDSNRTAYDTNLPRLSLACDANTPTVTTLAVQPFPKVVSGIQDSNNGEIIIPDVDYFGFLLGARSGNSFQYYTVPQFRAATATARTLEAARAADLKRKDEAPIKEPSVEIIKIAVLIKSPDEIHTADVNPDLPFTILGKTIKLKKPSTASKKNKFARRIYIKTVAIRNGLGDRL
ncbi:prepilin-type N-terminal cleavage/methylation domain-containing protein [Acinetobacter sp. 187]|uniref:prepilin-type N-terminal cleavage/methylation domain-containing protein n=1 Tax=Acinetobacter lanii TaxID=2715163 RepID=UPI00140B8B0D|nr:prepilin-type N-terminal cleavage/methylation domain-containing protein [Acinetobacter lanii]NHC02902.1 prepilin-type N-terminal cleavage/methylation domain-containing protein [Acinetobacter lanii]